MGKINIEAVHFAVDAKLTELIESKLEKLSLFYDQILTNEVILKVDKKESHNNKIVEIKLHVPGKELFAKKQADSFEVATDEAVEALRRQIKKHKEKLQEV
ncbi:MAG: ribosome-associated translation inhibitor RaiA [Flavobacteriales bacterium]|nr:ribosome-associated translation inhibitor RaiA [Flavobacteriales bacterium]MCB9197044.1 ribosome-associated translation inhibitor RaiA [Flavobacteriales bacterium]